MICCMQKQGFCKNKVVSCSVQQVIQNKNKEYYIKYKKEMPRVGGIFMCILTKRHATKHCLQGCCNSLTTLVVREQPASHPQFIPEGRHLYGIALRLCVQWGHTFIAFVHQSPKKGLQKQRYTLNVFLLVYCVHTKLRKQNRRGGALLGYSCTKKVHLKEWTSIL